MTIVALRMTVEVGWAFERADTADGSGRPRHSALILTLFIDMADVSTPRVMAISSARMLTAISAGVTAPISRPMGA